MSAVATKAPGRPRALANVTAPTARKPQHGGAPGPGTLTPPSPAVTRVLGAGRFLPLAAVPWRLRLWLLMDRLLTASATAHASGATDAERAAWVALVPLEAAWSAAWSNGPADDRDEAFDALESAVAAFERHAEDRRVVHLLDIVHAEVARRADATAKVPQ